MPNRKEIYRSVKLTDNIKTVNLSLMDQIRLLFAKMANDDVAELETSEKLTADKMRKISALNSFIDKAAEKMSELGESSVTVALSSEFLPYIDEVFDEQYGKGRYFKFDVQRKDIPIRVEHKFIVRISKKVGGVVEKAKVSSAYDDKCNTV